MLNLFDSHTHSDNSPDGEHSVTFLCEKAIRRGLMGFAITDHCDIDLYREDSYQLRIIQSVFDVRKAQHYFGDSIVLTAGIELGQPLSSPETARRALELSNFDVVLLSVHAVRGEQDFYFQDFTCLSEEECDRKLAHYFDEVLETVRRSNFDILTHLTYPLRYIEGRDGRPCDLSRYKTRIDEILQTLAREDKALELNTSGLRTSFGRTSPDPEIVARFHELGGRLVTVGSDAHNASHIGAGIEEGMQILRDSGFDRLAFYRRRTPRLLEIV